MKLSLTERLQFVTLLPEKGDFVTLTLKADIVRKIALTQEEITEWEVKSSDGHSFTWNAEKAQDKEIDFTEAEKALVVRKLKELDAAQALDDVTYAFHKRFI